MKTEFKIDAKTEAKSIPRLVGLAGESILTKEAIEKFEGKTKQELYPEILRLGNKYKKELINKKLFAEKNWGKIEKDYVSEMEKITGQKLKKDKVCYFASIIDGGIADVIGRKSVFIGKNININILNYIIMHEITHLHYSDVIMKIRTNNAGISPLMEGIAHLLLFKSPIKDLINSPVKYEDINFVKSNPKFMKELEKLWANRKDFESFVKDAIKLNKKFDNIKIC